MKCMKCQNPFTPNGTDFCSLLHKRQYERRNKPTQCVSPGKRVYADAKEAWEYIDSRPEHKLFKRNLRPYDDCPCRQIHIGHGEPNKFSRISA